MWGSQVVELEVGRGPGDGLRVTLTSYVVLELLVLFVIANFPGFEVL